MLSPSEIRTKEFTKTIKGYSTAEVDEYIEYLMSKYAEAAAEYASLEKKYKSVLAKLDEAKSEESTISAVVVNAQKMAETIVGDANEKARSITEAIKGSCEEILAAYRESVAAERDKLTKTEELAKQFKESLYAAYREHLDAIDRILPEKEEKKISELTDDELVDTALDLAEKKMNDSEEKVEETDLPPVFLSDDAEQN